MAWKYLNPGDYRLLTANSMSSVSNLYSQDAASVTGRAFNCYGGIYNPVDIPAGTKEIWMAITWIVSSFNTSDLARVYFWGASTKASSKSLSVHINANTLWVYINNSLAGSGRYSNFCRSSRLWVHIKSGVSDGLVEAYVNNKHIFSTANRNVMGGEDIVIRFLTTAYTNQFASDIIISDEPIDKNEHVAVLPICNTDAEGWTHDATNDIYTADSEGKTIWQVPDINQLKTVTGLENPSVTAVAIQAYNVSTNDTSQVDTLQKSVKQNGQIVITDSADISSATAVISPAMTINPVTNTAWTLSDLANLQLGITTAKSA